LELFLGTVAWNRLWNWRKMDLIYHYEMHPICSLQRHDRLTNGVTITQALRCQVDNGSWMI
jgi:hypothetical protein